MRKLDQYIVAIAESKGIKLAADAIAPIRLQLETAYLDSILDGTVPFGTDKQGDSNGRSNGKEKHNSSGQNADDGKAELHG